MAFELSGFEILARKDLDIVDEELILLRETQRGRLLVVLASKEGRSGAFLGGHNWEEIGAQHSVVNDFYAKIAKREDFHFISKRIRDQVQELVESGKT